MQVNMLWQVLAQAYVHVIDGKENTTPLPVTYMGGLFRGSQLNWAAFNKETHVMYTSIKKQSFYLGDANITVRSDHLPLQRFLERNTLTFKSTIGL